MEFGMAAVVKKAEHIAPQVHDAEPARARLEEATAVHVPVPSQSLRLQEGLAREFSQTLPTRWPVGVRLFTIAGLAGILWAGLTLLVLAL
jgi:hypothetical protein